MIEARFAFDYPGFSLDVDLRLPEKGVTALFGPSGSGKTTILRCFAGLIHSPRARLVVDGRIWQDSSTGIFLAPHKRPMGLVFQEASLFTHLSVRKNLAYGMKRSGNKDGKGLDGIVELLGIGALLDRLPERLSGGERQRVAIARALLTRPRLLLMDEPLAALDVARKLEILPYLERLHGELDIPVLYVSHAPDEVARLADYLVLLEAGSVVAGGPLQETLARTDLPGGFLGDAGVVLETTVAAHEDDDLTRLDFAGGQLYVSRRPEAVGIRLRCRIHARDVSIALAAPSGSSILNALPVVVRAVVPMVEPGQMLVQLELRGGDTLLARVTARSCRALAIAAGARVVAQVKSVALLG
jgi:molybdate transport system ATP-binding protein